MLKKNLSKSALVVALLTTTVIWRGTTAYAEDPNQAFTLDPMIVTAQRTETRDLDTPATTNIITEQNIKEAGYKNVFDAIEHQVGLTRPVTAMPVKILVSVRAVPLFAATTVVPWLW